MSIKEVQEKLALAEANAEHFQKLAAHPKLSFRAALAAHNSMRSYRAALELYRKALAYELEKAKAGKLSTSPPSARQPPYRISPPLLP